MDIEKSVLIDENMLMKLENKKDNDKIEQEIT